MKTLLASAALVLSTPALSQDGADMTPNTVDIVQTASAYADGISPDQPIVTSAIQQDEALDAAADIRQVMAAFDAVGADEMAVVTADGRVLGILSETYVRRRYAEELDKAQRELFGEA